MGSAKRINFLIRPNKNVERKLIAQCLDKLKRRFDIANYRYVGLGGFLFLDFMLFHRTLLITDMISIEWPENGDRAEFNRPLRCIRVEAAQSTNALPHVGLDETGVILWLDYDSDLYKGPVLEDLRIVCSRSKPGTVVIVTLNAHNAQLKGMQEGGVEVTRLSALRRMAPDLVSDDVEDGHLSAKNFPRVLARILFTHCKHVLNASGSGHWLMPLFNFFYQDDAPMITIGGMIVDSDSAQRLTECELPGQLSFATGEEQFDIALPVLTVQEKRALDKMLPAQATPTAEEIQQANAFTLPSAEIAAYERFYRYYPVFGELDA